MTAQCIGCLQSRAMGAHKIIGSAFSQLSRSPCESVVIEIQQVETTNRSMEFVGALHGLSMSRYVDDARVTAPGEYDSAFRRGNK